MKIVMTLMVRDEIDVIAAMLEHHIAQGVDLIIATDNGSVDGTAEVLQKYADSGHVELHHDPVHRKQQGEVVTAMARRAHTEHGADWVVNADADEFFVPLDKSLTLRECLERTPLTLNAFTVPVTNIVGPPAEQGAGVDRMLWRDHRTDEQLQEIGIHAQPTDNAVHRGDPDVVVVQGNHFVSLTSNGQPDRAVGIEVLHLPWRAWSQLEQKVVHAGRAYEANPDLRPSRNHHGMWDYRRFRSGRLRYAFLLRHPLESELVSGERDGTFVKDTWLRDHLHGLVPNAIHAQLLEAALDASKDDPVDPVEHAEGIRLGRMFLDLERDFIEEQRRADAADKEVKRLTLRVQRLRNERDEARRAAGPLPIAEEGRRLVRRAAGGARRRLRAARRPR